MHLLPRVLLAAAYLVTAGLSWANPISPVGYWKTIDDKTELAMAIVEIYPTEEGTLEAKVVEILDEEHGPNPRCQECPGELRDKPVMGMVVMWDLKEDDGRWTGGRILDPRKGKVYKAKVALTDEGNLEVRGYIGLSLFGRTQIWRPVEPTDDAFNRHGS